MVGFPSREAKVPFPPRYHWDYMTGMLDEMFGGFGSQTKTGQWNASTMNLSLTAIIDASGPDRHGTVLIRVCCCAHPPTHSHTHMNTRARIAAFAAVATCPVHRPLLSVPSHSMDAVCVCPGSSSSVDMDMWVSSGMAWGGGGLSFSGVPRPVHHTL